MANVTDYLSPAAAIRSAKAAHPAFKYATAVLGLVGIVAVASRWGLSPAAAVFGAIILVVLMVLFFVFAQATALARAALSLPAQLLVWSFLIVTIASAVLLFTSAFFDAPLPLRSKIVRDLQAIGPNGVPLQDPGPVPPGRLLSASPFRARLDDCTASKCSVDLFLRGYDSKGRLRYDARDHFASWTIGQFRDTTFNSSDRLYFEAGDRIAFQIYCRLGQGPVIAGDHTEIDWQPWHEKTDGKAYAAWMSCGSSDFKASAGIGVGVAQIRFNEPPVRDETGPPIP